MAADSIAKLSVLLTADTGPLARGLQAGGDQVVAFQRRTQSSTGTLMAFNRMSAYGAGNLAKLTGATVGLNSGLLNLAKSGGGFGVAIAALGAMIVKSAQWADSAANDAATVKQAYEDAFSALANKSPEKMAGGAWSEGHKRLMESLREPEGGRFTIANIGKSFSEVFGDTERAIAAMNDAITSPAIKDAVKEDIRRAKEMLEATKKHTEELKRQEDAQKKASEEFARRMSSMKQRASSISQALRTPTESYAATIKELHELQQAGLLTLDEFNRGVSKAQKDLLKSGGGSHPRSFEAAAVERFSSAASSAVTAGKNSELQLQARQAEMQRLQLEAQRETNRLLKGKPTTVVEAGKL